MSNVFQQEINRVIKESQPQTTTTLITFQNEVDVFSNIRDIPVQHRAGPLGNKGRLGEQSTVFKIKPPKNVLLLRGK